MFAFKHMKLWNLLTMQAIAITLLQASAPSHVVVAPSSSRVIPKVVIEERFPGLMEGSNDPKRFIFEISNNGVMNGPNLSVPVKPKENLLQFQMNQDSIDYSVNGKARYITEIGVFAYDIDGYSLLHDRDGEIVNFWGGALFLEPLDQKRYPGVFVNTRVSKPSIEPGNQGSRRHKELDDKKMKELKSLGVGRQVRGCRVLDVAIAYDNSFCARFGNAHTRATAYVKDIVYKASFYLNRDTCHRLRPVRIEAHCKDPVDPYQYQTVIAKLPPTTMRSSYVLSQFRSIWLSRRAYVQRDAAFFFSGYSDGTGVGGAAYFGSSCTSYGFAWVELGIGPVFTHEMGHVIGALHSATGIMKGSYSGGPVFFSQSSKAQINSFLRTSRSSCIGAVGSKESDN